MQSHYLLVVAVVAISLSSVSAQCWNHYACESCNTDAINDCSWCATYSTYGYCVTNATECQEFPAFGLNESCPLPFCSPSIDPEICALPSTHTLRTALISECQMVNDPAQPLLTSNVTELPNVCLQALRTDGDKCIQSVLTHRCTTNCALCPEPTEYNANNAPSLPSPSVCSAIQNNCPEAAKIANCLSNYQCRSANFLPTIRADISGEGGKDLTTTETESQDQTTTKTSVNTQSESSMGTVTETISQDVSQTIPEEPSAGLQLTLGLVSILASLFVLIL